jgi:hypothetical protein
MQRSDYSTANAMCSQAEHQLGVKAYLAFHNGCYKIVVGDFKSFREASDVLELARKHYPDAWISPPYNEFIIHPIDVVEVVVVEPTEMSNAVYSVKEELLEIREVLNDMLLVLNEVKNKIKTSEEIRAAVDADTCVKATDPQINDIPEQSTAYL